MENPNATNAGSGEPMTEDQINALIITNAVEQYGPIITQGKTKPVEVEPGKPPVPVPIKPDERIAEAKKAAEALVIDGIADEANYKLAKSYHTAVKKWRTSIENKRKELKAVSLEYGRRVDGEAKRLTALVEPVEKLLAKKIEAIDKAAEIARKAEELRRHNLLVESGWQFTGSWYVCGIQNVAPSELAAASDDQLTQYQATGQAEKDRKAAEDKRKAEEDAAAAAETARIAAEAKRQAEENERLRKQLEELQAKAAAPAPVETKPAAPDPGDDMAGMFAEITIGPAITEPEAIEPARERGITITTVAQAKQVAKDLAAEVHGVPGIIGSAGTGIAPLIIDEPFVKPLVGSTTLFDYTNGFNDCRHQVLALFADGVQRTRKEWVTIFENLKPAKK